MPSRIDGMDVNPGLRGDAGAMRFSRRPRIVLNGFAARAGGSVARLLEVGGRAPRLWNADIVMVHNPEIDIAPEHVQTVGLPSPLDRLSPLTRRCLEPWLVGRTVDGGRVDAVVHYGSYLPIRKRPGVGNILFFVNMAIWDPGQSSRTARNRVLRRLLRKTIAEADLLITQSEASRAYLLEQYPALESRIAVVSNGCSVPALVRSDAPRDFVLVGQVYAYRRIPDVVRAYARLPEAVRRRHSLVVVGSRVRDPAAVGEVTTEVARLGLGDQVRLTGQLPRSRVLELLVNAAALLSFASIENCPNVVLEAKALGVPMILSDIPAHRELGTACTWFVREEDEIAAEMSRVSALAEQTTQPSVRGPVDTWDEHVVRMGELLHSIGILPDMASPCRGAGLGCVLDPETVKRRR